MKLIVLALFLLFTHQVVAQTIPSNARKLIPGRVYGPNHEKRHPLPASDSLAYKRWGIGLDFSVICNKLASDPKWAYTSYTLHKGPAQYENMCESFWANGGVIVYELCFIGSTRVTSTVYTCQRGMSEEAEWEQKLLFATYDKASKKWIDKEAGVEVTRDYVQGHPFAVQYIVRRIREGF